MPSANRFIDKLRQLSDVSVQSVADGQFLRFNAVTGKWEPSGTGYSGVSGYSGFNGPAGAAGAAGVSGYSGVWGCSANYYIDVVCNALGTPSFSGSYTLTYSPATFTWHYQDSTFPIANTIDIVWVSGQWQLQIVDNTNNCATTFVDSAGIWACPSGNLSNYSVLSDGCSYSLLSISNDYIGPAGPAGPTGSTGNSGTSGYSGKSGYSGAVGQSGYSGQQGVSGYSGQSGVSGYSGSSGSSGRSGFSGLGGLSGTSGYSGIGLSGTSGYSGTSGISGYSGKSGISGYSGATGASGYSGTWACSQQYFIDLSYSGVLTPSFTGPYTLTYTPATGTWHYQDGAVPIANTIDIVYSSGQWQLQIVDNTNGCTTILGDSTGYWACPSVLVSSYTSVSDTCSSYSLTSISNNYTGATGSTGSGGSSGTSGFSGYSGVGGNSGTSGYSGATGSSGTSGYSGLAGSSGTSGYSGVGGNSGTSGYSGAGLSGVSGYSGIAGTSGISGYSGVAGSNGTSGYSGVSGYSGSKIVYLDIGITVDGGGSVISTGSMGFRRVDAACTILSWTIIGNQSSASSSCVMDVKKSTYSNFPTTTSITGTEQPTLGNNVQIASASTLAGWTTSIGAGDVLEFVVNSAAVQTRVTLLLKVQLT